MDLVKHKNLIIKFRKDSFFVSFGEMFNFDEEDYLDWLKEKAKDFSDGFVLLVEDNRYIGQLVLTIHQFEGEKIGYVNLFYLVPEMRGIGKGKELVHYANQFFKDYEVSEYHLRVSPSNSQARKIYQKIGMEEVGPETDGKVIRMRGRVDSFPNF